MDNMEYADLLTLDGQIIRLECPDKYLDDFYDSLSYAMKRGDSWSPDQFEGCTAEMMGIRLSRINMNKIVGIL